MTSEYFFKCCVEEFFGHPGLHHTKNDPSASVCTRGTLAISSSFEESLSIQSPGVTITTSGNLIPELLTASSPRSGAWLTCTSRQGEQSWCSTNASHNRGSLLVLGRSFRQRGEPLGARPMLDQPGELLGAWPKL